MFTFTSSLYGPFDGSEESFDLEISYRYGKSTFLPQVNERLVCRDQKGALVGEHHTNTHTLSQNQNVSAKLTFYPYGMTNTRFMDIYFYIYNVKDDIILCTKQLTLQKKRNNVILDPREDELDSFCFNDCAFNLASKNLTYSEIFDFSGINDLFAGSYYYDLNLSNQVIDYYYEKEFTYDNAYLLFKDTKNIFKYMKKENNSFKVPLKVTQDGYSLKLSFKNNMFVNRDSLQMSLTYGSNTKTMTNHFYVPINCNDLLDGKTFSIVIEGAGANKCKIRYDVEFYSSLNLFGYCYNSKYCVKEG